MYQKEPKNISPEAIKNRFNNPNASRIALCVGRNHLIKDSWAYNLHQSLDSNYQEVYDFGYIDPQDNVDFCQYILTYGPPKFMVNRPNIVIENGYINRLTESNPNGYMQFSAGDLNTLVPAGVKSDRIPVKISPANITDDMPILILAQVAGDKQHGLSQAQLNTLYDRWVNEAKSMNPDQVVWFRNHPASKVKSHPYGTELKDFGNIELLTEQVKKVITYNSTGALPFLARMIPVQCNINAFYADYAAKPTLEGITELFSRIGYSQWNTEELKNPHLVRTILEFLGAMSVADGDIELPEDWKAKEDTNSVPKSTLDEFQKASVSAILETKVFTKARKMLKNLLDEIDHPDKDTTIKNKEALQALCNKLLK